MVLAKFQGVTGDASTHETLRQKFCVCLCDRDPSVMGASLNGLFDAIALHGAGPSL